MKISNKQLEQIKQLIDKHLEIRGIKVETKLEFNEDKNKFELTSSYFQTFPVIHQNLFIHSLGSSLTEDEIEGKSIYINVNVRYDGNGVNLFVVRAKLDDKYDEIYAPYVGHIVD